MPRKNSIKLFLKTWPPHDKESFKNDENNRPLTATLDKPQILDIRLIGKLDMSLIRKEFLSVTNLCRVPLTTLTITNKNRRYSSVLERRLTTPVRPLSLPCPEKKNKKTKRLELSDDSWEEEDLSVVSVSNRSARKPKQKMIRKLKTPTILSKIQTDTSKINDSNNNNAVSPKKPFKVVKKRAVSSSGNNTSVVKSIKLPEPCTTCGRADLPERFHSHPTTLPSKASRKLSEELVKIPVKNSVQKPVAIKFKSKQTENKTLVKQQAPQTLVRLNQQQLNKLNVSKSPHKQNTLHTKSPLSQRKNSKLLVKSPARLEKSQALIEKSPQYSTSSSGDSDRPKSGKGPKMLTCYLCGREFGTASLPLHEPKCLQKWERENATLPPHLQRKPPKKPDHPLTQEEWNKFAWEASQATLTPCENCGRTFYPDRLLVHLRSCKPPLGTMEMSLEKSKSIGASLPVLCNAESEEEKCKLTLRQKIKVIFGNITVEPIMICYILPCVLAGLSATNLSLEKACRVNLGMEKEICDGLTVRNTSAYTEEQEADVQKLVAAMAAWKNVILSLIPALLLMFLGSWSDRHNRRKPVVMLPILGEMVATTGFLFCTYFFYQLPMEVNAIAEALPPALTGGWNAMFVGVYSYVSSLSNPETRTVRIGAVSMFSTVSVTIGIALSGILYKSIGLYGVFSTCLVLYSTGLIYGFTAVKEKRSEYKTDKNCVADFFDLKHIKETFAVAFKEGENHRKKKILTIMILVMVIVGPLNGEFAVFYLFVRYKFKWNEIDYSIYSTYNFIIYMIGTMFSLLVFSKYMKVHDSILGIISSMSKILASIVYAFAPTPTIFYLGAIVEMFNGTSFIAMRSIVSKLVPADELGKINSLFGVCESLMPLVYAPLYSIVYTYTINVFPGTFFLLGGVLTMPAVLIFLWLYTEDKKIEKMNALEKEQKERMLETDPTIEKDRTGHLDVVFSSQ